MLATYLTATLAYSLYLKRTLLLAVLILAALYTLRIRGEAFRPWTFREGPHHVRLVSPDGTQTVELDLMALPAPEGSLEVSF